MTGDDKLLEVKDLSKRFGGLMAVNKLTFSLEKGKVTGLIGPNGAGKTTVFNLISGFLKPDIGKVYFKNIDITDLPPHEIVRQGIARTFQDLRLFHKLTVLENLLLGFQKRRGEYLWGALLKGKKSKDETKRDLERGMELLKLVGLDNKARELFGNLAYGEQKLLALTRLIASNSEVLMLDEPAAGLPLGVVDKMLQLIRDLVRQGKTVLLIEHNMEAAMSVCDWIFVLDFGEKIASGTPDEIKKNEEVIRVYLGI